MEARHEVHHISFKQIPVDFRSRHPSVHFHVLEVGFPDVRLFDNASHQTSNGTIRGIQGPAQVSGRLGGFKGLLRYGMSVVKAWAFLRGVLRKFRPDVLFGGWIQKDGIVCALTNYHPFLLMPWGSDALILPFRNSILRIGSIYVIRQANRITCDAEDVKNSILDLVKMNPDDIVVFPWGVEHNIFDFSITGNDMRRELGWEDNEIVINTRGFQPEYDPMTFVGVLPSLCHRLPDLRIVMCGTGELEQDCREFIDSHGLEEKVHFAGYVTQARLAQYYAAADIFVSSSLTDGTAISLLEAMTMGLPVVVTEVPAIKEWIEHGYNGLLFPAGNGEMLQSSLELLIRDEGLRRECSLRNRGIALERADWDRNYEKLEKIFLEMTSG